MGRQSFGSPSPLFLVFDQLVTLEFGAFLAAAPALSFGSEGDGRPVLVLPPFGASDWSTAPLRAVLRQRGYATYGWKLGGNIGPHPHIVAGMERRLGEVHRRHQTAVTVIGWSLGGVYARELARIHPQDRAPSDHPRKPLSLPARRSQQRLGAVRRHCAKARRSFFPSSNPRTPARLFLFRRHRSTPAPMEWSIGRRASTPSARRQKI